MTSVPWSRSALSFIPTRESVSPDLRSASSWPRTLSGQENEKRLSQIESCLDLPPPPHTILNPPARPAPGQSNKPHPRGGGGGGVPERLSPPNGAPRRGRGVGW